MTYRHHTTRCRHGFARDCVPCEACGDKLNKNYYRQRPPVINKRGGRPKHNRVPVSYRSGT